MKNRVLGKSRTDNVKLSSGQSPAERSAGGDARFLQFLEQAFVELAVDVDISLQQAVFDCAFVKLVGFLLLLLELLGQHGFLLLSRQILPADAIHQLLEFDLNLRVDFLQLIIELGNFRI